MKKHIYLFALLAITVMTSKANVLTVSNDSKKPATYTTISAAMTAANVGDTIFVSGTATDYAAYRELCGVIRGLAIAQQEIEDLVRRYKEDDDE